MAKDTAPPEDFGPESDPEAFDQEVPDFGDWHDFEKAPVLVGTYVGTHDGNFGVIHDFSTPDGEPVSVPGHKMLTRKLKGLEGLEVRVELTGEMEPSVKGRQPTKVYSVRYRKA